MARIKLNYAVAASTLVEVLISMIVIVVVFGIALMIFANVIRFSPSEKQLTAKALLNDMLLKTEEQKTFSDQSTTKNQFFIQQTVLPYGNVNGLISIKLTAFDQHQQKVAEIQKIINSKQ